MAFKNPFKKEIEETQRTETSWELERKERFINLIDIIAPPSFEIKQNYLKIGDKLARTYFVINWPSSITANWLSPIINFDRPFDISMFIYPVETSKVLKQLQKRITEVEAEISEREEKGLVRDPQLESAYRNIEDLRDNLILAQEKMFKFGIYFTIYADQEQDLEKIEKEIRQILESQLIYIKPALFRQKEGFYSAAPLLLDQLSISTSMNTSPLSVSFPFVSFELTSDKGILYGINRHNNSLILFDRFSLENGNIVIFAKSGSGKSYFQKLEILRSLTQGVDVIIIDPENEYKYLTQTVGGAYFNISLTSPHHINPLDLPPPIEGESKEGLFRSNIVNLVGLLRLMLGGLTPEEDAITDSALNLVYQSRDITPDSDFFGKTPPLLEDLQKIFQGMEGGESLATRLEKYTKGAFSGLLNNHTNINLDNRLVVFSIRDLEDELRPIAIFLILHYIWNTIRSSLKKRILVIDEAWWMMQYEDGASFLYSIAKRARKYYLGLSTITQDVADFMRSQYGQPIIANSSLQLLLKQSPATIDIVVDTFHLTQEEKNFLLQAEVGEGLFFAGSKHVAIKIIASYGEDQIITTDPEQLLAIRKAKEELEEEE
ncbi:MAG TPA: ATP-binding protein [Candidatus Pacearchaeota archaeon]|nr:ATP-binding protein [Candidatus Pacearchaeota archaeon]HOK93975.1 ATP-binding protein [Candidatus Pacearchaeota archaeon]HPO75046.1 ATP-binding protein [Candidatus Pacearchaeota archaeon]